MLTSIQTHGINIKTKLQVSLVFQVVLLVITLQASHANAEFIRDDHFYETAHEAHSACINDWGEWPHCTSHVLYGTPRTMGCFREREVGWMHINEDTGERLDISYYFGCEQGCHSDSTFNAEEGGCSQFFISTQVAPDSTIQGGVDDGKNKGEPCPSEGNPINPATGNKFETAVDYASFKPGSLKFIRYYNSSESASTALGTGWQHNYARRLTTNAANTPQTFTGSGNQSPLYTSKYYACTRGWVTVKDNALSVPSGATASYDGSSCILSVDGERWGTVPIFETRVANPSTEDSTYWNVIRADGKTYRFVQVDDGWQTDPDIKATLESIDSGLRFTDEKGNIENYDNNGRLLSIDYLGGRTETLSYNEDGHLKRVTSPFGRSLEFTYNGEHLISVTQPGGGVIKYNYDENNNLTNITYPDNRTIKYLYERADLPHALTGIIDENGNRYATWSYDSLGRAVSSEHAGGAERVILEYHEDGSVTSTNALGKKTTYHFETIHGVPKVVLLEGHPTNSCAGANRNYSYNDNGFLLSKTDWNGITTTYLRDAKGHEISRTEAVGTPSQRTITTEWHPTLNLPLKVTKPGKMTLYDYDDMGRLLSVTKQSNP